MPSAQGQDRSNFQATGPWTGLAFGFAKATEGLTFQDETFPANWASLGATDKVRGAYHFFHPALSAEAQARMFVSVVRDNGLRPGDLLVADIEITAGDDGTQRMSVQAAQRSRLLDVSQDSRVITTPGHGYLDPLPRLPVSAVGTTALEFLETVSDLCPGNPVLVYTNLSVAAYLAPCTAYDLWLAYPADAPPASVAPWKTWRFWQWAFSGGFDDCDQDAYNGTADEMRTWVAGFLPLPPPAPPVPPIPVPTEKTEVPMLVVWVDRATLPEDVEWPGEFLLFSTGKLHHILSPADLAAYKAAGILTAEISYPEYAALVKGL